MRGENYKITVSRHKEIEWYGLALGHHCTHNSLPSSSMTISMSVINLMVHAYHNLADML